MTPTGDLPETGTAVDQAQTYDDQVKGISDLLEDPDTDLQEPEEDKEAAPENPDGEEGAEDADKEDADDPDGSAEPEFKGGRFAADDAKVRMDDGSTITIAELKRNNLYQRGFTEKTMALAEERKTFEARRSEVDQLAQSLSYERELHQWFAENYLKPPDPSELRTDPLGYMQRKEAWEQVQGAINYFRQARAQQDEQSTAQSQEQLRAKADSEWAALQQADPTFKDRQKATAWYSSAVADGAKHYGISEQDIRNAFVTNHGLVLALKDALAYRRLKAKAPEVSQQLQKRPAMVKGGQRAAPGAQDARARQARSERLRQTGSMEDFVAAVQDLL